MKTHICNYPILTTFSLALTCMVSVQAGGRVEMNYTAGWDSAWQFVVQGGRCELSSEVPTYGTARFTARQNDGQMTFEFAALRDAQVGTKLPVFAVAPGWHTNHPGQTSLGAVAHIESGGLFAKDAKARELLRYLQLGWYLEFRSPTIFTDRQPTLLELSALNIRPAVDHFVACAKLHARVPWSDLQRSRVNFAVDLHQLTQAHKRHLDQVVDELVADEAVTKIFIDGHTDDTGIKARNVRLSKKRAQVVTDYLKRQLGKHTTRKVAFVMRYHADGYPVGDNQSSAGRAQNRRTTIRLQQAMSEQLARNR